MNRSLALLIAGLLGLTLVPFPDSPASPSCAAPYLELGQGEVIVRDDTVTVAGRAFSGGGCQDSMSCTVTFGCEKCTHDDPPAVPLEDVALRLVQAGRTWKLAVADAGSAEDHQLGWITWSFEVPAQAAPGPARLVPDGGEPVRVSLQ